MATINKINSNIPIEIAKGGTNAASMSTTDGVGYYDGTRIVTTSAGTSGYLFTSNGSGSAPTYQVSPSTQGALMFIQQQTASTVSTLNFTTGITSYTNFLLVWNNVQNTDTSNSYIIGMRLSDDAGSTWKSTSYLSDEHIYATGGAISDNPQTTYFVLMDSILGTTTSNSGYIYIVNRGSSSVMSVSGQAAYQSVTTLRMAFIGGTYTPTITCDGFQILITGSTMATGTFTLYGIRRS